MKNMEIFATKPEWLPDNPLSLAGFGYWCAIGCDAPQAGGRKLYFDPRLHGESGARALLADIRQVNADRGASLVRLDDFLRVQETVTAPGFEPDMVPAILQVRSDAHGDLQGKAYFLPRRRSGIGLRVAAGQVARLVASSEGQERARAVLEAILARDTGRPLFYIAISWRPDLEIETYHDAQATGEGAWDATQIGALAAQLALPDELSSKAKDIVEIATRQGFSCRHLSCDLVGGDGGVSLFLDAPDGSGRIAFSQALRALGLTDDPGHCFDEVPESMVPFMVGIKLPDQGRGAARFLVEFAHTAWVTCV